jgi:hypothetical protein
MQVAKITLYDGRVFHTDDFGRERLRKFFDNVRAQAPKPLPEGLSNQVDLIEMTPEDYAAIPATVESDALFNG